MSSPSKARGPAARREQGEKRRREILDATLRVIARQGVARVTHRAVAAEALARILSIELFPGREEVMVESAPCPPS